MAQSKKTIHKKHKNSTEKIRTTKKPSHPTKQAPMNQNSNVWKTLSIVLGVIIIVVVLWILLSSEKPPTTEGTGEVVMDMYVMSQCPYGAQAETEAIKAVQRFGGDVTLNIHYIVSSTANGFQSLHGQPEVDENIRQLCIKENYPEEFFDYMLCFNSNYQAGEAQFLTCTDKNNIDIDKVTDCVLSQGSDLLKASEAQTNKVGATGSPTIYVNDEAYNGGRAEIDFARYFCDVLNFENSACDDVPKPVEFTVIVLTSKDCTSCDTSRIKSVSVQLFPGAKFVEVDLKSTEGKKLVENHNLKYLPAYIFDSKVTETNSWKTNAGLQTSFVESGGVYRLLDEASGANWILDPEKRDAYLASIGVVKGDNKPQIDFFVMSYCPYGNMAEEGIAPVYEILKDKADFNPRYVIYSNYQSGYPAYCLDENSVLCSMHGIVELHQDIREACVTKYFGMDLWFNFVLAMNSNCNAQNADTCWEGVADTLSLNKETIKTCEDSEGYALMLADKEIGDTLGVRGSPAVFIDGEQYNGARDPNAYLTALCAAFEDAPAECDKVLAAPPPAQVPAGGSC